MTILELLKHVDQLLLQEMRGFCLLFFIVEIVLSLKPSVKTNTVLRTAFQLFSAISLLWLVVFISHYFYVFLIEQGVEAEKIKQRWGGPYSYTLWLPLLAFGIMSQIFWVKRVFKIRLIRWLIVPFVFFMLNVEVVTMTMINSNRYYYSGNDFLTLQLYLNLLLTQSYYLLCFSAITFVVVFTKIRYGHEKN